MLERRKTLVQKESGIYQFEGDDRFTVLYNNQRRDALFAKAKIPPGDGRSSGACTPDSIIKGNTTPS
jgi:hypothetical protein